MGEKVSYNRLAGADLARNTHRRGFQSHSGQAQNQCNVMTLLLSQFQGQLTHAGGDQRWWGVGCCFAIIFSSLKPNPILYKFILVLGSELISSAQAPKGLVL